MTTRKTLSQLDWSLFALRWLLVISIFILALLMPALDTMTGYWLRERLLIGSGVGVLLALVGLALVLGSGDSRVPGIAGMVMDIGYALFLFWVSDGMSILLVGAGALPVVEGALRVGGWSGLAAAGVQAVLAVILRGAVLAPGEPLGPAVLSAGALALIAVCISVPIQLAQLGWTGQRLILQEREAESARLRHAREQARAIYEMASTLSATLNYQAVLDAALDVGVLGLREIGPSARLVSAVLLFDNNTGQLMIANARRMPQADLKKQVPGRRGALGLALRQAEPVFAHDASRDPELRYFVAFQDARSILCVPLRAGFDNYGVLVFGSTVANAFSEEHVELLTAIASQATIALQNATLYQDLLDEKNRIIEVEEDARRQLSRDLHDGPTQSVAAIAMRVNYIRRLLEREPGQVPEELEKVEDLARQTTKEIRHMLFTLRPLILETQGLVPALHELAKKMADTHQQNVIVDVQEDIERYIDPNDQNVVFNIVDECVNNARKHAEAEHIWVRLRKQENYLVLEVQDDGVGFDKGEVDANYDQRGSLGMINLRERSELINGTLRIETAEGKGAKITVIAPIREAVLEELKKEPQKTTRPRPPAGKASQDGEARSAAGPTVPRSTGGPKARRPAARPSG
ncbi:MAG: GAF domain-containing sensor histidine kinase [Acidobacteria bacterium]|nr:GAF domain-containing sensor histidine kinase [Acidobacteriota bacterium]